MGEANEAIEQESLNDEQIHKKGRHRKKQLYNSILQQMEFYFSDSNLTKDRFLSRLVKENPIVDLNVFLKFNKIRKLTTNIDDIRKAVKNSKLIELTEDKNYVFRKVPIKEKTNVDDCTIYVERLNSDATHDWIQSVFSEFGNVEYISLPKYKHNNAIKGFAFVEYETEKEAQNALAYFESIGCKMPSNIEPEELCSIATFEKDAPKEEKKAVATEDDSKKRKFDEIQDENESEEKEKKAKLESEELSESEDTENKKKKKLKKEHKKKNYIKELGLQVLSKKEWKKMRNRYLELQKKKMQEFKRQLFKAKYSQANYDDKFKKPNDNPEQTKTEEKQEEEAPPKLEFVEGTIVKIKLTEPCADTKKFKNDIKASSTDVKYVDIPNPGSEEVFVRFANTDSAKSFCKQDNDNRTLLEGEEEKAYWDKILKTREDKFKKERKKQRGRDKLLKKANQAMVKHIKFDE